MLELLEDPALVSGLNTNARVDYLNPDPWIRWIRRSICGNGSAVRKSVDETGTKYNAAFVRVFDRVSEKVYENLGYAVTQRLPKYYSNGGDGLLMLKSLD